MPKYLLFPRQLYIKEKKGKKIQTIRKAAYKTKKRLSAAQKKNRTKRKAKK